MRQLAASAIILEVSDLGERDRLITFLTAEHGKKRGAARGARGKFSRFAGQLQPLARVHLSWFERDDRDLVRVSEASVERAFSSGDDLERLLLATYLADTVVAFAQENEESHTLFRLLDMAVERLLRTVDPRLVGRYFEIWVLRLSGIFPVPRACPRCERPFADGAVLVDHDSGLVCPECAGGDNTRGDRVASAVLAVIARVNRESLDAIAESPPTSAELHAVEKLCARVRRAFLGRELRSYAVMQQTLRAL
jgi:DNA repair protein RecO (recombination protein O)